MEVGSLWPIWFTQRVVFQRYPAEECLYLARDRSVDETVPTGVYTAEAWRVTTTPQCVPDCRGLWPMVSPVEWRCLRGFRPAGCLWHVGDVCRPGSAPTPAANRVTVAIVRRPRQVVGTVVIEAQICNYSYYNGILSYVFVPGCRRACVSYGSRGRRARHAHGACGHVTERDAQPTQVKAGPRVVVYTQV
eukprot:416324-Prymnesium_polylepis.1